MTTHTVAQTGALAARVLAALDASRRVPYRRVAVSADDGRVVLTGCVTTGGQRRTALRIAERTEGVTAVVDEIALDPGPSAETARACIREALAGRAGGSDCAVSATAHAGAIVLTGHVPSQELRRRVLLAAWSTPHVREVKDRLRVEP